MPVVMRQWGAADGRPLPKDGWFLQAFDFEAHEGRGEISLTPELAQAKRFANLGEALDFRNRSPECKPRREDGKPNRPLTAATWGFERVEE